MTRTLALALTMLTAPAALADDSKADLAGSYTCNTTYTIKLTAPAETTLHDTGTGELAVSGSAKADSLFSWSADGVVCHQHAKRAGTAGVKFTKGETCQYTRDGADLTKTLVTGSGGMVADELTVNLSWRITGTLKGYPVSGSATEVTNCEKH